MVVLEERCLALDERYLERSIWKGRRTAVEGEVGRWEVGGRRSGRVPKMMCLETRRGKDGIEGDGDID